MKRYDIIDNATWEKEACYNGYFCKWEDIEDILWKIKNYAQPGIDDDGLRLVAIDDIVTTILKQNVSLTGE